MKLKHLAFAVFLSQVLSIALSIYDLALYSKNYPTGMMLQSGFRLLLALPMILFFFYVWKRSKSGPVNASDTV